jgi:hypothetical protein
MLTGIARRYRMSISSAILVMLHTLVNSIPKAAKACYTDRHNSVIAAKGSALGPAHRLLGRTSAAILRSQYFSQFQLSFFARMIHGGFYCNCGHAATTSQYVHNLHTGGRARPSRPQRTASSTPRPLGAPRARLAWRLHSFVTSLHESCALAAPRRVPVLPVRSRGSMPALGADVDEQRKRVTAGKDSRYIFLSLTCHAR